MTSHLVIGAGEVGRALHAVIGGSDIRDIDEPEGLLGQYDVLHIALPWQIPAFVDTVQQYEEQYSPIYTVIHSTVPVGTCDQHEGWVHSPVRGKHPNLEEGLRTFAKHYGGAHATHVAEIMESSFPNWCAHPRAAMTEAAKLWELASYGIEIMLAKEIHQFCEEFNLPFTVVYEIFGETYNEGWAELGHTEYQKPILRHMPGPIGGHCVIPGSEMLYNQYRSHFLRVLIGLNQGLDLKQQQDVINSLKEMNRG